MQLRKIFFVVAAALAAPAAAQTTGEDVAEEVAAELAAGQRPDMPGLFFRGEQRRVLEAVRQGVVEQDDFSIEEFVPVIIEENIEEDEIVITEVKEIRREREEDFALDAYIVNRSSGKSSFWLNGNVVRAETDSDLLAREGMSGEDEGEEVAIKDGVLHGGDLFIGTRFRVKVGQVLGINGSVEETLPVVRVHKK